MQLPVAGHPDPAQQVPGSFRAAGEHGVALGGSIDAVPRHMQKSPIPSWQFTPPVDAPPDPLPEELPLAPELPLLPEELVLVPLDDPLDEPPLEELLCASPPSVPASPKDPPPPDDEQASARAARATDDGRSRGSRMRAPYYGGDAWIVPCTINQRRDRDCGAILSAVRISSGSRLTLGALAFLVLAACDAPIGAIRRSPPDDIASRVLATRTKAPPIALEGTQGLYKLADALTQGPQLLVFYRGHW